MEEWRSGRRYVACGLLSYFSHSEIKVFKILINYVFSAVYFELSCRRISPSSVKS